MSKVIYFTENQILQFQLPHHLQLSYLKLHNPPNLFRIYTSYAELFLFSLLTLQNDEYYAIDAENQIFSLNDYDRQLLDSFEMILNPEIVDISLMQSSSPVHGAKGLLPLYSFASTVKRLFSKNLVAWHLIPISESPNGIYHVIRSDDGSDEALNPTIVPNGTDFERSRLLFTGTLNTCKRIIVTVFEEQSILLR
jgi:hypothetical protein